MCASPVRKNANFSRNSAYAAKFSAYGNWGLGEVLRIMPQGMRLKGFFPFHELLHHGRVVVREEQTVFSVESFNLFHFRIGQLEIENVEVLLHSLFVSAFGDYHNSALQKIAQSCLGRALVMSFTNFLQYGIAEKIVSSFGKRSPRHDLATVFLQIFVGFDLLVEHMCFHLIHCRLDFHVLLQIDEAVGVEIAHAYGFTFPSR